MYIIDETYFTRDLHIPNISEAQSESLETLESFVDEYVPQLLRDALGITVFNILDSYVISGVFDGTGAPQYIIDLVEGKEYTSNNVVLKWDGLISEQGVFKKSLLSNYVYSKWFENNFTFSSGVGEVTINAKNANLINPTQRIVTYWNKFVDMYQGCVNHYPEVYFKGSTQVIDWLGNNTNTNVSLIKYLQDNEADFPYATLRLYEFKNQLGF